MTPRHDLASSVFEAERDLDAIFKPMSESIHALVLKHAFQSSEGPRITASGYVAITRELDTLLNAVFPQGHGQPSPLEELIVRRANDARLKPIAVATDQMRARLKREPDLLKAMGDG